MQFAKPKFSFPPVKRAAAAPPLAEQMLDMASACFDAATLESLARMRLSRKQLARVDKLAAKANEGQLTPAERAEYRAFITTSDWLVLLQLRARRRLGLPLGRS